MKAEIYRDLTDEEKIGLLHYIRGQQGIVQHAYYQTTDVNPSLSPCVDKVYVSSVLDIDFDEFYNTEGMDKSNTYKQEIKQKSPTIGGHHSMFIGDAINDILYVRLDIDINRVINKEFMKEIDTEIKELYDLYIGLGQEYAEVKGLLHEGEKVYRRVK